MKEWILPKGYFVPTIRHKRRYRDVAKNYMVYLS